MKTIVSLIIKSFVVLVILCLAQSLHAQTFNIQRVGIDPHPPNKVCAQEIANYEIPTLSLPAFPRPADFASGASFGFVWAIEDGVCNGFPPPCNTGSTVSVKWDNICEDGRVSCTVTFSYTDTSGNPGSRNVPITSLVTRIHKLTGAQFGVSGPTMIECADLSHVIYTVTGSPCAIAFNWTLPPQWDIISGHGTSSITVEPHPETDGTISVQAINECIPESATSTPPFAVVRGCPDNKYFTTATSSLPTQTAVHFDIVCDPSSGWITVPLGQEIYFKAGESVTLEPPFEAEQGAFFQARTGLCTSCLAFKRQGEEADATINDDDSSPIAYLICPNPSNGVFTIGCDASGNETGENVLVLIYDLHARLVMERTFTSGTQFVVDLQQEPQGVYVVQLSTQGETLVQKIQKF